MVLKRLAVLFSSLALHVGSDDFTHVRAELSNTSRPTSTCLNTGPGTVHSDRP